MFEFGFDPVFILILFLCVLPFVLFRLTPDLFRLMSNLILARPKRPPAHLRAPPFVHVVVFLFVCKKYLSS